MNASVRLTPSIAILVALALACNGDLGPGTLSSDTYVLEEVDGDPVPAVVYSNEFVEFYVVSDTIRLRHDGTGTISGVRSAVALQPGIPGGQDPTWGTADIRFRRVLRGIEIDYVCPANADCAPPPHLIAAERDNRLEVSWAPSLIGRSPMIYTAVD
jgi:hypothetical protein